MLLDQVLTRLLIKNFVVRWCLDKPVIYAILFLD